RYYFARNRYWSDRGVPGPAPELLFGNLRAVWAYDRPRPLVLKEWTKQFGKVYGFLSGQRPFWVISDPSIVSEIFVKRFDNFYAHARAELQESQDCADTHMAEARGGHWKRLRALSTDAFSGKAIRNIFPTIKQSANHLVECIQVQQGKEIDAMRYFREYTMDIITKVALGKKEIEMFKNGYVTWCSDFFLNYVSLSHVSFTCTSRNSIRNGISRRNIQFSALFIDFPVITLARDIKKTVLERKRQRVRNKLSLDEIVVNCKLFLLAGFDTTSITLSRAVHFFANHPEVQERLREEVDDVIGDEDFDLEVIGSLPYAEAVVKETLRHHPLGSGFTTRECTEACEIGGYKFEKGDMIMPDVWSLQMDKEVWGEDAEEFRPERWLEDAQRDRAAYLAFGEGPRICLGMKMAIVEAKARIYTVISETLFKCLKF
ncbi:hypothetical protein PMAYCL1PPCAC_16892, partial [Pristionchus mayeri]